FTGVVVVCGAARWGVAGERGPPLHPGGDVPAQIRIGAGGQGANLAIRLARRGIAVELLCALGDDPAASLVIAALRAEGVRVSATRVSATGSVVILVDEAGERTMLSDRASFVAGAVIPAADWIVVSGYCFLEADAARLAGAVAGQVARRVVVGCAVPDRSRAAWRAAVIAARPDLLILNREEASDQEPLAQLSAAIVVTATDGVMASIGDDVIRVRVPDGSPATDTTGAGDAFAAGLVAGLLRVPWPPPGAALESAMTDAAVLARQVARTHGAQARVAAEAIA
ncbi:MAG: carbohydrate kinase family protein, partial [Candidatus Limnocylindria bacterium]